MEPSMAGWHIRTANDSEDRTTHDRAQYRRGGCFAVSTLGTRIHREDRRQESGRAYTRCNTSPPRADVRSSLSTEPYWCAAQLQPGRDRLALHFLQLNGFQTYAPRLRDRRIERGRKVIKTPLIFPGYVFVQIELQWSQARWAPGIARLVMDGDTPAVVPNAVIRSLKSREVGGLIELPKPPKFKRGDHVQIRRGPFAYKVGLVIGMRPRERVALLLHMLGGARQIELSDSEVERWA